MIYLPRAIIETITNGDAAKINTMDTLNNIVESDQVSQQECRIQNYQGLITAVNTYNQPGSTARQETNIPDDHKLQRYQKTTRNTGYSTRPAYNLHNSPPIHHMLIESWSDSNIQYWFKYSSQKLPAI